MKFSPIVAHKYTKLFRMTSRKQTVQGECIMNEQQPNSIHWTHRKGNQSQLFLFHSKGSRFSSWGLLHCDDRRSPWWASRDRPQHDRSRSDTVMISMNFNSYARLYFSSFLFFLVCFWNRNFIYYTSVSCVWFLLPYVNLQSNWAWKPLKLGLSILFYLWGFLSLFTLQ